MSRQPYRPVSGPSAITPIATPVDTYVRPADPPPSSLHQLAEGLASFDSGLGAFLEKRKAKTEEADKIRAEAAFNKNNAMGWAEAVRQGKVPANASPIFMQSYKAAQGNLAGIQLRERFTKEYLSWDGRQKNDPQAFQKFLGEFVANNIGTDDVEVLRGLNPHIEALKSDAYSVFTQESAKSVYNGSLNTRGAILGRTVDAANDIGLTTKEGTDYDAIWQDFMANREEALAAGTRAEDYDAQLVATITAKAVEHQDPQLLDLLDYSTDGSGIALKDFPTFGEARQDAINKLETIGRQQMLDRDRAQEKKDKAEEEAITAAVVRSLSGDPGTEIPEEMIQRLERFNPKARTMIAEARKSLSGELEYEDPREILLLQRDIAQGANRDDIMKAAADGRIRSASTMATLLDRVDKYSKARQEGTGILTSQTAKRFTKTITERAVSVAGDIAGVADMFGNYAMTDEALEAIQDFETGLMQWDDQNPNATVIEREKFINDMGETILRRIDQGADPTDPKKYEGSQDQAEVQFQDAVRAGSTEQPQGLPEGSVAKQFYSSDQPPMLDRLPPDYQKFIDEESAKSGMTADEFNQEIWKKTQELLKSEPDATLEKSSAPMEVNQELGAIIDAAFSMASDGGGLETIQALASGDLASALDLLGTSEGTDRGRGYNETLGYGAYTGGPVELTTMTLGQVKELQREMLAHPDNSWNSSAVGRYQIVGKTLRKLQQEMGLSDDALFDEKTQDAMAAQLIKGRGYDKWKAGEMSDSDFLNSLAKEWASLPTDAGVGYYEGQRASVGTTDVLSAFAATKGGSAGQQAIEDLLASGEVPPAYSKIPQDEIPQFIQWNPDPVGNHEANLQSIDPTLGDVVRRAQEIAGIKFVVGSGKRDPELQKKAVEWGWSKTEDSDHLDGGAVDLWPLDDEGSVVFEDGLQMEIVRAMEEAAAELGVELDIGAKWKSFKDKPHFALK